VTTDEVVVVARSIVEYRLLGDRAAGVFVLTPRLWKRRATVMSARPLGCLLPLPNSQYAVPAARYVGKQPCESTDCESSRGAARRQRGGGACARTSTNFLAPGRHDLTGFKPSRSPSRHLARPCPGAPTLAGAGWDGASDGGSVATPVPLPPPPGAHSSFSRGSDRIAPKRI